MRAAESLVNKPSSPVDMPVPPKSPGGSKDLKTTTIVMSKHTLAPQNPPTVSNNKITLIAFILFLLRFYFIFFVLYYNN